MAITLRLAPVDRRNCVGPPGGGCRQRLRAASVASAARLAHDQGSGQGPARRIRTTPREFVRIYLAVTGRLSRAGRGPGLAAPRERCPGGVAAGSLAPGDGRWGGVLECCVAVRPINCR